MKKMFFILLAIIFAFSTTFFIQYRKYNNVNAATYSWGSTGETVRIIQDKLKRWGYLNGSVDGIFGSQTYNAVIKFQQKNNLLVDGIVGKQTLEALGIFESSNTSGSSNSNDSSNHENNVWLLASLINGEARGESYTGQVAVGAVVLNRVRHASFPNTISGVIYQSGQFEAVADGQINLTPSTSCLNAARDAMNGWDPTNGAIYYWNPKTATNKWMLSLPITTIIGNHAFAISA
jgi:spore cortex-lytic enzyme